MYDDLTNLDQPDEDLLPAERPRIGSTVIRLRRGKLDLETCSALLVEQAGMLKLDAKTACVQGGGILVDNIDPKRAAALVAALSEVGEPCFAIPAAQVVPLPRVVPVHSVHLTKTDLGPLDTVGRQEKAPWEAALVLALTGVGVPREERKTKGEGSILSQPIGTAGALALGGMAGVALSISGAAMRSAMNSETAYRTEQRVWLDLVFLRPLRRYRIDSGQFDYSLLGDQLALGGDTNIQTLARWFLYAAPQMLTNVNAAELQEKGKVRLPHTGEKGLNELVHWLINLARFGKRPEG